MGRHPVRLFLRYGEVYLWRVNKTNWMAGWPIIGRHTGYIGQTRSPLDRDEEHLFGGGRWGKVCAPWSDLEPTKIVLFRMERCPNWLLDWAEVSAIKVLRPVYNHAHNGGNPRRVGLIEARTARARRDARIWR